MSQDTMRERRVIVLSGGGSRGAWGGGFLQAMDSAEHPDYVAAIGTSTGSLLGPLILSNNPRRFQILHQGYTQAEQSSIFNVNPFKEDGNVKGFQSFLRLLFGAKNIGETKPLRNRIKDFYSEMEYTNLRASGKEFVACVTNMTSGAIEYKSSQVVNQYEDMIDWAWASANQPVFMTAVKKEGGLYVDGGIRENIPIVEGVKLAVAHKVNRVDVVIHNSTDQSSLRTWPEKKNKNGIIPKIFRVIDVFSDETRASDIIAGVYAASQHTGGQKIELHMYSMPISVFTQYNCYNSLIFQKQRQLNLWNAGYAYYPIQKALKAASADFTIGNIDLYLDK